MLSRLWSSIVFCVSFYTQKIAVYAGVILTVVGEAAHHDCHQVFELTTYICRYATSSTILYKMSKFSLCWDSQSSVTFLYA